MKKLSKHIFTMAIAITSLSTFAQLNNIDLNNYKLTNYRFNSLSTNLSSNNSFGKYNSSYDYKNHYIYNTANINFFLTKYNRQYYGYHSLDFNVNNSNSKSIHDFSSSTIKSFNNNMNIYLRGISENNFYIINDFFIGFNVSTIQSPNRAYQEYENITNTSKFFTSNYASQNSISFLFGKGRIENVADARLAIYILEDLANNGRLTKTPSEEEVFKFADFINEVLNHRIIDSRIKRIQEYTAIDSFLVSNEYVTKTDGLYFGLVNDNWNYARGNTWETGNIWNIRIAPFANLDKRFIKQTEYGIATKQVNEVTEYGLNIGAEYSSRWINGLNWQSGYNLNSSFNVFRYDTIGTAFYGTNYKNIVLSAQYFKAYIPNTRTYLRVSTGIIAQKDFHEEKSDEIFINPFVSGQCSYYFSQKLRFQLNSSINYQYEENDNYDSKSLNFNISAGIQYYFF